MASVHVHIHNPTARARYAIEQVLQLMLGWELVHIDDVDEFSRIEGPKLNYGPEPIKSAFHVVPSGLLGSKEVERLDPVVGQFENVPHLFPNKLGDLPYDIFAGSFFLLSRYEEVVGLPQDEHDRPLTEALHGARYNYIDRPVVDEWALQMAAKWKRFDPRVPDPKRKYTHVITVDLDNGFMYRGRELWRTIGSATRDLLHGRFDLVAERQQVLTGSKKDPYDVYDDVKRDLAPFADKVQFFVLNANRGAKDHAVPLNFAPYAERLKQLGKWAEVGIHPSYESSIKNELINEQISSLQQVLGAPITRSRQHFLRMKVPDTYRALIKAGITEEHSMGLHDRIGFRAGTCTPYTWFDLEQDTSTALMIHPFGAMDNTLRSKLKLSPSEAIQLTEELIERIRRVNGTFTGLWHESFLSDHGMYKGWGSAIRTIIAKAKA